MSSETTHITRQNYEEYFLLYVDNELSPTERMAVENFVSSHPDLREELDILLQTTILEVPSTSLGDKTFLMADSMKFNTVDDSLLLYLDKELNKEESRKVEKQLKSDPDLRAQYDLLLRTKLPQDKIAYPNKAELYRRTERAIGGYWLRVAAAVIIIAAVTLVYFVNDGSSSSIAPTVADADTKKNETLVQPEQQQVAVVPVEEKATPVENRTQKENKDLSVPVRQQMQVSSPDENKDQIAYTPVDIQTYPVRTMGTDPVNPIAGTDPKQTDAVVAAQQNINTGTVTDTDVAPYNHNNKDVVTTPKDYAFAEEKGSVKGLLRKATRFIEKRTGVNPVNEDDELLIGVVAIKLK